MSHLIKKLENMRIELFNFLCPFYLGVNNSGQLHASEESSNGIANFSWVSIGLWLTCRILCIYKWDECHGLVVVW